MEHRISQLIEGTINDLGYELVKVTIYGSRTKIVEILIERQDNEKIQVHECHLVSKNISPILDVEDIISEKYFLEVSSAGLERPLIKPRDFERFSSYNVKIRLKNSLNGRSIYKGKLLGIEDNKIKLKSKNVELTFDHDNIKKANLVLTEELFRALLNKKK